MAGKRKYSNAQILAALKECKGMVYLAADKIGCDADTIYHRAKSTPSVAKCIGHQRGQVVDTAELKLYTAILAGEPWAIRMALTMLGKDRGYTSSVAVSNPDGSALNSGVVPPLEKLVEMLKGTEDDDTGPGGAGDEEDAGGDGEVQE